MENIKEKPIKLLILSYHYLPLNVIASYRPAGFAQHLYKFGIYPTIVTHRWETDKNGNWITHHKEDEVIIEKDEKHRVIRIPRYRTYLGVLYRWLEKYYLTRQILIVLRWFLSYLDPGAHNTDSYIAYKRFLFEHLKTHSYDMMMGIYSPHHHLKLCYEINRKFGIPYILDFRDLWDNRATDQEYSPKGSNRLYVQMVKKHWAKWLSNAEFFTTLSDTWINKISDLSSTPGHIVMHGYDNDIAEIQKTKPSKDEFILLFVGSLYHNQDLKGFLKGVKFFIEEIKPPKFKLVLLGTDRNNKIERGFYKNINEKLNNYLQSNFFLLTKRVPREKVLLWLQQASLMVSLTYKNETGRYGGKFFEYIGTGRPVLVYGERDSIISRAVQEDKLGFVCTSPDEVSEILKQTYFYWRDQAASSKISKTIHKYSRENQTKILSKILKPLDKL